MTHDTYDTCFYNYYYIYLVCVLENKTFLPARVGIYENKCHKCHVSLLWVVCFFENNDGEQKAPPKEQLHLVGCKDTKEIGQMQVKRQKKSKSLGFYKIKS